MFDIDRFNDDCAAAIASESNPQRAVREILQLAVERPKEVMTALGEPTRAGLARLLVSDTLTVLNVVWGPHMTLMPHNHNMWAAIGVYTGREDNIFWRRLPEDAAGHIEAAGARSLAEREVLPLGRDIIHSVTNPVTRLTGAIHVYGGDFFAAPRSEWDPEDLSEQPYRVEHAVALFERSNRMLRTEPAA